MLKKKKTLNIYCLCLDLLCVIEQRSNTQETSPLIKQSPYILKKIENHKKIHVVDDRLKTCR